MKYTLERSNDYLVGHSGKIDRQYRPRYHLAPPVGWMNDPNGVCLYRGALHVFYQYYPYDSCWGPMHWGHAATQDNCVFRHYPVALAPDREDESGCFSGGAVINKDNPDELFLLYTRHYEKGEIRREVQALASSSDGVHFHKEDPPVIEDSSLPEGCTGRDFRDPNPVLIGGEYFVFVGTKNAEGQGQVLVYSSSDGKTFRYRNSIFSPWFGRMAECPDFFRLDGKDVLLVSAIRAPEEAHRFRGCNSSLYLIGSFDSKTCTFTAENCDEIDGGYDFYAPQTCEDGEGRRVMVAWMDMWEKEYFLHRNAHGYSGALTYPRTLSVRDGLLYQSPAPGVEKYRVPVDFSRPVSGCLDLTLTLKEGSVVALSRPGDPGDALRFGMRGGRFWVDLSGLKNAPQGVRDSRFVYGRETQVRALVDASSAELFVDGGRETFTERFFIEGGELSLELKNAEMVEGYGLELPEEDFRIALE